MYDSDVVRDEVRREMMTFFFTPGANTVALASIEAATLAEARMAYGRAFQVAAAEYLAEMEARSEFAARFFENLRGLAEKLAQAFVEAFRPLMEAEKVMQLVATFEELSEAIRWAQDDTEGDGFSWRRRPRRMEVRPVREVDAVAAGRSPGMVMRTRIRGGRR